MDENNMTTVLPETPDETTAEAPAAPEETAQETPNGAENAVEAENGANGGEDNTTPPQETTAVQSPQEASNDTEASPPERTIAVRYKRHVEQIPEGEVGGWVAKGRQLDELTPTLDRIAAMAQARGQDLNTFVDELEHSFDANELQALTDQCGGNAEAAKQLFDLQREKRRANFKGLAARQSEEAAAERESLTQRMGDDLAEVQKEFPDIRELRDLPPEVVREACDRDIALLDSYLRWQLRNGRRVEEAKRQQAKAAEASTGSIKGGEDPVAAMDEQSRGFLAAFRRGMA